MYSNTSHFANLNSVCYIISNCLLNMPTWISNRHLKLNISQTKYVYHDQVPPPSHLNGHLFSHSGQKSLWLWIPFSFPLHSQSFRKSCCFYYLNIYRILLLLSIFMAVIKPSIIVSLRDYHNSFLTEFPIPTLPPLLQLLSTQKL